MSSKSSNIIAADLLVRPQERSEQKNQKAAVLWLTGISGSGKSTLATLLDRYLTDNNFHSFVLDGDNLRGTISSDLGFSDEDRQENIRRTGEIAKILYQAGILSIVSLISPFRQDRALVRQAIGDDNFHEIFVKASLEICEQRDPKGFYKKARSNKIKQFTGIDSLYQAPQNPQLIVDTENKSPSQSLSEIITYLKSTQLIK